MNTVKQFKQCKCSVIIVCPDSALCGLVLSKSIRLSVDFAASFVVLPFFLDIIDSESEVPVYCQRYYCPSC